MDRRIDRKFPAPAILLLALGYATAASASCNQTNDDRAIRNAVNSGATIVISSEGTFVDHAPVPRRAIAHHAVRPPALRISYNADSPTLDDPALKTLVDRANRSNAKISITVWAFATDDDCRAARLAQERAVALREKLLEFGATPSQLRVKALGGRYGHDRAEFRLSA